MKEKRLIAEYDLVHIGEPGKARKMMEDAPTIDAVEVVRCRDCKYRFKNNGHSRDGCPIVDAKIWMDDDDFCSHGERKDGNDE